MTRLVKTRVWGIWVPNPAVLDLRTQRVARRTCIKDYMAWYGKGSKPRLKWSQLYRWGWRCLPVTITFNKPQ